MSALRFLDRPDRSRLAYRVAPAQAGAASGNSPTIVFLPGYASDMAGTKATALFDWAQRSGHAELLFDYAGCGTSEGDFADQLLGDWRDDALGVIDAASPSGPLLLVGSSLGGWLMLLVALALTTRDGPYRIAGLIGIAAAPDFTDWGFSADEKAALAGGEDHRATNPYGPDPVLTTARFWASGQANLLLGKDIALDCPVRLIHGQADADVPWEMSVRLAGALRSADVQTILVKAGDHRLSRDVDIALLLETLARLLADIATPRETPS